MLKNIDLEGNIEKDGLKESIPLGINTERGIQELIKAEKGDRKDILAENVILKGIGSAKD
ncbi:MAG TPA: hypothetical protein ENI73_06165 [Spirochaetes bacterium]|nr:hypothetical protein [Spirochaetota bacterium]